MNEVYYYADGPAVAKNYGCHLIYSFLDFMLNLKYITIY